MRVLENLLLAAAVLAACVGWGRTVERTVGRLGSGPPLPRLSTGVVACLGLAASLCSFGVFVALEAYHEWIGWLWVAAGLVIASVGFAPAAKSRGAIWLNVAVIGVLALVSAYMAVRALGAAPWNSCDDLTGYLPLGDRLLETGGMIEPFSLHRVTGFGGATVLETVFTSTLGSSDAFVMDLVFGTLLLGLLLMPFSAPPLRVALGALALLSIPFWRTLHWNLSPIFLIVALMAAAVLVVRETRRTTTNLLDPRFLCLLGILGAGLLTIRFTPAVPVVAFGVALVASASGVGMGARLRGLSVLGLTMLVALTPWMLALWRSSGTPVYPPFAGNVNTDAIVFNDPGADFWLRVKQVFDQPELWLMTGGILLAGALMVARHRREVWARTPLLVLPGIVAGVMLTVASISAFPAFGIARAVGPVVAGAFLAALILLAGEAVAIKRVGGKVAAIGFVVLIALTLRSTSNTEYTFDYDTDALSDLVAGKLADYEPWGDTEDDYAAAQAAIPAGAKVATSTDFPASFDYGRNDFVNMDIVGAVSPPPRIPLGGTTQEMTAYLHSEGFDFAVLTDPATSICLWNRERELANLATGQRHLLFSRDIVEWLDWARERMAEAPALSVRHGSLITLDLRAG